jgi:sigma-B regulation protein RsbU (phosphoserine phosphatase)
VLRWVNAAHDPAAIYARNADAFLPADGTDIPLGVDDTWAFTEHELVLPQDEIVLALGTDGIWETEDAGGVQFGHERFCALVRTHAALPAADLCRTIMDEVARYRAAPAPVDDVTLVIIKFTARGDA